ncbi:MAG: YbaB/EbfC family nucleoid-associated protein [Alphaproteobacteria bacterium]|nr:YbaB/EbfC family nucleoid-associated protein [Alphaproteobacteria bacterium]
MNIQKMMKQAQQMQAKLGSMQAEMEQREFEGASGGGAVKITLTGKGAMTRITLEPTLLNAEEKEMLEDLIQLAHRDAKAKADAALADAMGALTGGLNLPAGMKLPF